MGKVFHGPRDVWGLAVAQKYKVHQNAPLKTKFKKFFPDGPREKVCFFGPAVALDVCVH